MFIAALGGYSAFLLIITVALIINFRVIDLWSRGLNEREALIDQREAIYEAKKKEVEYIISFLIKELNKQGANHDK